MQKIKRQLVAILFITIFGCGQDPKLRNRYGVTRLDLKSNSEAAIPNPRCLLPKEKAHPVSLANASIEGYLGEDDMREIVSLLGRIQSIDYNVDEIRAVWGLIPVAALVRLKKVYVYLVKNEEKEWMITEILVPHFDY